MSSAAEQFEAAFTRLKENKPVRLPKDSLVTQNNVAREAGKDPSALKKHRFPTLVSEIQRYVADNCTHEPRRLVEDRTASLGKKRAVEKRLEDAVRQRDVLASKLSDANAMIIQLHQTIEDLAKYAPENNVIHLRRAPTLKNEPI